MFFIDREKLSEASKLRIKQCSAWRLIRLNQHSERQLTSSPAEACSIVSGTEFEVKWWPQLARSSSNGVPTWEISNLFRWNQIALDRLKINAWRSNQAHERTCLSEIFNEWRHPASFANPPISSWSVRQALSSTLFSFPSSMFSVPEASVWHLVQLIFSWISDLAKRQSTSNWTTLLQYRVSSWTLRCKIYFKKKDMGTIHEKAKTSWIQEKHIPNISVEGK